MSRKPLTRHERFALFRTAVAGLVGGLTRAVTAWLLDWIAS